MTLYYVLGWYLFGFLNTFALEYFERKEKGFTTVGDVVSVLGFALFGPLMFVVSVPHLLLQHWDKKVF